MPSSRLNTKNRVSLKIAVLKIVMHAAVMSEKEARCTTLKAATRAANKSFTLARG
jgi:hypothetical protein